jgi:hypothetical protein
VEDGILVLEIQIETAGCHAGLFGNTRDVRLVVSLAREFAHCRFKYGRFLISCSCSHANNEMIAEPLFKYTTDSLACQDRQKK